MKKLLHLSFSCCGRAMWFMDGFWLLLKNMSVCQMPIQINMKYSLGCFYGFVDYEAFCTVCTVCVQCTQTQFGGASVGCIVVIHHV